MPPIDRSQGLARQIADSLQEEIMQGRLGVEDRLPSEQDLAERFEVSQPTVREAMKILAAKKLVRSKRGPKGGVFVAAPSLGTASQTLFETTNWLVSLGVFGLGDIVETRRLLGATCVRLAAERATEEDLARIEAALQDVNHSEVSDEEFCRLDVAFHHAVAEASHNAELNFIMVIVNDSLIPATNMISFKFRERDKVIAFHHEIHRAIAAHDPVAACAAFDGLISYQSNVYDNALHARDRKAGK